jgi:hypothetical protein
MRTLIGALTCAALLAAVFSPAMAQDFWSWWGDGKGELSSYKVVVSRYGERREGYSVLIFVTEDISRTTRIKVESEAIPPPDRAPVLKLNRVVKFTTGLYDYSILTSTFSSVNPELGRKPYTPQNFSFWRRIVATFSNVDSPARSVELTWHSYFQSEGDQKFTIKLPAERSLKDNLPIWFASLAGGSQRRTTLSCKFFPALGFAGGA